MQNIGNIPKRVVDALTTKLKDTDKVIFLIGRIERGTQSLKKYRRFADKDEAVQATENTGVLVTKSKRTNTAAALIVISIQKRSNIRDEGDGGMKISNLALMSGKRIVFIVDECHRSTFGDMLLTIKHTFPKAIFFGFTARPFKMKTRKS